MRAGALLIEDGRIAEVLIAGPRSARPRAAGHAGRLPAGAFLAPGIVDIGVKVCEPGERHKESFRPPAWPPRRAA